MEPLDLLGELSLRTRSVLRHLHVNTLGDLHERTAAEVVASRGFAETPLRDLREKLAALGLSLEDGW